jgi:hypothetical protein
MPETTANITYLPQVECTVQNGMLNTAIIGVADEDGNHQYLRVGQGSVATEGGKTYLPIGIVELDRRKRRALVELPVEADSGARRLWVPFDRFRPVREHS